MKKVILFLLFICFVTNYAQDSTVTTVGPGVRYHSVKKSSPNIIKILEIDLTEQDIKIESVLAKDVLGNGFETPSSASKRKTENGHFVLGAINADFFGMSTPYDPFSFLCGSMISNSEFVQSSWVGWTGFAIDKNKKPFFDKFGFSGYVKAKNNLTININAVNWKRDANTLVLYNKFIGASTSTNPYGVEVKLQLIDPLAINTEVRFVVVEKQEGVGNMTIGNYYVLSGHDSCARFLTNHFNISDTVKLKIGTNLDRGNISALVGGGPRLMTNGIIPNSFTGAEGFDNDITNNQHPRTAVGINQDSTKLYFVTVDGRQAGVSIGMTLSELAHYMKSIGCYQANNFDGGGSSAMIVRNQVMNVPSDGSERPVGNILLAVLERPLTGIIKSFHLSPELVVLDSTQTKKINIKANDIWGYPLDVTAADFTWEVKGISGYVDDNGFFVPSQSGTGIIIGTINDLHDTISVNVLSQILPTWSFCSTLGNIPSWFSTTASTERGFAVGNVSGNPRLYIVSRPNVYILDANTGAQVGSLNTNDLTGGTYTINDIEVSDDGIIFGGNLTANASTNAFKIYKWNNELSTPEPVITFSGSTGKLGDKFTVVGSYANNTAVIYAAVTSSNKVYKWVMENSVFNQTPILITLPAGTGTSPAVYPRGIGDANIFVNGNGVRPCEYTSAGVLVATAPSSAVDIRSNSMRYFESGQQKYLIVYQYGFNFENAQVLDITNGLANATVLESSPILGTNYNTVGMSGDIAYRYIAPGRYIYYVLATNNGFAAYQLINPEQLTDVAEVSNPNPTEFNIFQNYPNPFNPTTSIRFQIPAKQHVVIKIFDILGNEISKLVDEDMEMGVYNKTFNASQYSSGIYFCNIKTEGFNKTIKMILAK